MTLSHATSQAVGLILLCLLAFVCPYVLAQTTPRVVVRTSLTPRSVMIGETATLNIDILTDTFFLTAPELPPLAIPGVIVRLSDERPSHLTEQINGVTMYGLQRTYHLIPVAASTFEIPAFQVISHPGPGANTVVTVAPRRQLQAAAPAAAQDAFVTRRLRIEQKVDTDLATLNVGDAFTRTVEVTATGTPAMFIPDITFADIDGLSAYPQTPSLQDATSGPLAVGHRTFTVNYVVQEPGDYELPAISMRWWSLETRKLNEASVPALQVHAIAVPPAPAAFEIPSEVSESSAAGEWGWRAIGITASAAVATILVALWLTPHIVRGVRTLSRRRAQRHARYLESERYAYKQLLMALRRPDARSVPALYRWIDRVPSSGVATHMLAATGDAKFVATCQQLLAERYGGESVPGVSARLRRLLPQARHRLLSKTRQSRSGDRSLRPMNPM